MKSAAHIIDGLGGSTAVGDLLELPATTVASWKSRNSIPARHWSAILRAARARGVRGITLKSLTQLAVAAPQRAAS